MDLLHWGNFDRGPFKNYLFEFYHNWRMVPDMSFKALFDDAQR